jgi:hypothetical protein
VVAVIADVSAPMTSDQWARAAVDLAVDDGASEIAVEGFAARETYQHVVKDASAGPSLIGPSASPPGHRKARAGAALLQGLETGTTADRRHLPDLEGRRDHRPLQEPGQDSLVVGGKLTPEVVNGFVNETGRNCRDDVRRTVMAGTGG